MTPRLSAPLFVILILAARTVVAQDALRRCALVVAGPGEAAFLAFDKELRSALSSGDAATLALLVRFPLRVSFPDGATISLHDPATVQLRFQEVFTPLLRKAVMNQKPETVFCNDDGIVYLLCAIVGGGSGPKARPMNDAWVAESRDSPRVVVPKQLLQTPAENRSWPRHVKSTLSGRGRATGWSRCCQKYAD